MTSSLICPASKQKQLVDGDKLLIGYESTSNEEGDVVIVNSLYSYSDNIRFTIEEKFGEEIGQAISNPVVSSWILLAVVSVASILLSLAFLKLKDRQQ